jgi:hypothetical protein
MKKHIALFLLAAILTGAIVGCGSPTQGDPAPMKSSGTGETERKTGLEPQ